MAFEKYSGAAAKADELGSQRQEAFRQITEQGLAALDRGDAEGAQQQFKLALMIDPQSDSAKHGLERALKVEAVKKLIEAGQAHEKEGNLSFAHADYQEAVRIDPESEQARKAFDRVQDGIKNEEFQQPISEGLAAYHKKDYQLARNKLMKAKSFKPESTEVRNALAQVDEGVRLARIEVFRQRGVKAESDERWQDALESYLAALKIDKNVQFAARGKERSLKQIQIDKRINFFLQNPAVLESDRQLQNAILLVKEVEEIEPKGARRAAELKQLMGHVKAAQTPVKVTIESDNFTEVAIYKVGKLGRFAVRDVALRPGTYTVVGARDGYQDVRQELVIKPGQGSLRISVKCEVEI
jgi:tetratricopeptide (TPR) repeat protein